MKPIKNISLAAYCNSDFAGVWHQNSLISVIPAYHALALSLSWPVSQYIGQEKFKLK
jgi:hypothetical protein